MKPSHPHHDYLVNVEKQIRRGSKLTAQLLGYARQRPSQVAPLLLNKLIAEVLETFGRTRKNIVVQLDLDPALYPVNGDPGQLEQILLNLFVNASDAMPAGGTLRLKTRNLFRTEISSDKFPSVVGDFVKLEVSDTGVGMTPDTVERIFDPFFTTKEMGRGTGLGLASVYGIVKGHGGYIDVASEPGHGSTFTLYFPPGDPPAAEPRKSESGIKKGNGVVLLVDDEALVLEACSRMLQTLGFTVHRAGGGREGIDLFRQRAGDIDLVILDIVMPEISGEAVYRQIKEIDPAAKVLVSSGFDYDGKIVAALRQAEDGFIRKPFSLEELSEKLREMAVIN